jgi:hypothetical protein
LVDSAFGNLHAAKVVLVNLYAEEDIQAAVPGVLVRLQTCLPKGDKRRQKAEALFGSGTSRVPADDCSQAWQNGQSHIAPPKRRALTGRDRSGIGNDPAMRRAALREAMQVSYDAADEQYSRVRSFRNILIIGTILLTLLVVAVCLVGAQHPTAIPLCFHPSSTTAGGIPNGPTVCPTTDLREGTVPSGGDIAIVALMGVLGGALSATFSIQKLRGTSTPYAIPVALAFLKLPAGALTAIAGLMLIQGAFIPGLSELDTQGQILAYAIVFGVAQQLVTRFVDQKADDVLSSLPSKENSPAGAEQPGQEAQSAGEERPVPARTA